MAVLVASLLHDLACASLHKRIVFWACCSSNLDKGKSILVYRSCFSVPLSGSSVSLDPLIWNLTGEQSIYDPYWVQYLQTFDLLLQ
jgi:hypothetical protein